MDQVQYLTPGQGAELAAPDAVLTVKVGADHTDQQFEVFEVDAPRGPATPLHTTGWAKCYYVLTGRMLVQLGDEAYDLGAGASIVIPPGAWHTFTVLTPSVQFLAIAATGAMGRFHRDLADSVDPSRPLPEVLPAITAVLSRHPVTMAAPDAAR